MNITNDLVLCMLITYPLAMNKDFLNGKSIGKRIFGIQVRTLSKQKSSEWKNSLRNFLLIIPFDFFFTLFSPKRRIGDYLAKTKIEFENKLTFKTIRSELSEYRLNKELGFGLLFGILNVYGIFWLYNLILFK